MDGIAAIFIVLRRPKRSITNPPIIDPKGTINTTTLANQELWDFVTTISLFSSSNWGINIAEYARAIPTTIW